MYCENWVNKELLKKGIDSVDKLNIRDLSEAFGIDVYYWDMASCYMAGAIIIDIKKEPVTQYEEFLHELAHVIYMGELKTLKDFNCWKYIEGKVNALVPYLAIPEFALGEIYKYNDVKEIATEFGITYDLAFKRLIGIKGTTLRRERRHYEGSYLR